jgi:hypothetical protein
MVIYYEYAKLLLGNVLTFSIGLDMYLNFNSINCICKSMLGLVSNSQKLILFSFKYSA